MTTTDTDTLSALLAGIIASPNDDVPRLVYADALDDVGEAGWAALIRRQCDGGTSLWCLGDASVGQMCHTNRQCPNCEFVETNGILPFHLLGEERYEIRRGFVDVVKCELADWLAHGPRVVRAHPVQVVTLTDVRPGETDRDPGFRNFSEWTYHHRELRFLWEPGHLKVGIASWRNTDAECMSDLSAALIAWARSTPP